MAKKKNAASVSGRKVDVAKGARKGGESPSRKAKRPDPDLVLAITYDVWISGTKLGMQKKSCINSIEVKETVDGADSATITIQDPEFRYIEDNIFLEDNPIRVTLGWQGVTYRVQFDGFISAIDIAFNSDGIPQLTVTCMDNTHRMNREKKDRTWNDATSADVARQIAGEYGFGCVVEGGYQFEVQETITQSHQTDIEFLSQLAGDEVYPFTARLVGNDLHYEKLGKMGTPAMELKYVDFPHDVISFSPRINKESRQQVIRGAAMSGADKTLTSTEGTVEGGGGSATEEGPAGSGGSKSGRSGSKPSSSGGGRTHTYNPETKTWT